MNQYLQFAKPPSSRSSNMAEHMIICLDASPSMEDTDWPPTRYQAAVEATKALIACKRKLNPQDEIGVVAYAEKAKVVCHPTAAAENFQGLKRDLRDPNCGYVTNLSAGLLIAFELLRDGHHLSWWDRLTTMECVPHPLRVKRIILLTDGEHNTGKDPAKVAAELKRTGVCIDCIGIGGSPSAVNESLLKEIASSQPDGRTPRYVFIGDKAALIQKFKTLAGRITR